MIKKNKSIPITVKLINISDLNLAELYVFYDHGRLLNVKGDKDGLVVGDAGVRHAVNGMESIVSVKRSAMGWNGISTWMLKSPIMRVLYGSKNGLLPSSHEQSG